MKKTILALALLVPSLALASIFQCQNNGKIEFRDEPCDKGSNSKEITAALEKGSAKENEAYKLVKLMKLDSAAKEGLESSFQKMYPAGSKNNRKINCIDNALPDSIAHIYARIIKKNMSSEEIKSSIDFYSTGTGKKAYDIGINAVLGKGHHPSITKEDENVFHTFMATSAGKKLSSDEILNDKEFQNESKSEMARITKLCQ
jgi:hypothetical protein